MILKEIKVGELTSFLASSIYVHSSNIPITKQRAISQLNNPRADKEEVALIIALDMHDQIIGFIGMLPDYLKIEVPIKVYWNSCWWIDPLLGKKVALPLFFSFLKSCDNKVMFRDMTVKTKEIITRLNKFHEHQKIKGVRYFLRFNLSEKLPKKFSFLSKTKFALKLLDNLLNEFLKLKSIKPNNAKVVFVDKIDKEANDFIQKVNKKEYFKREKEELNWIITNPWVIETKEKVKSDKYYYFSNTSKVFKNYLLKVYEDDMLKGVLFINNNNGFFKMPYAFYRIENIELITSVLSNFLKSKQANSFLTFNSAIIVNFKSTSWYKQSISKEFVISKKLQEHFVERFQLQDGDGDFCFT